MYTFWGRKNIQKKTDGFKNMLNKFKAMFSNTENIALSNVKIKKSYFFEYNSLVIITIITIAPPINA